MSQGMFESDRVIPWTALRARSQKRCQADPMGEYASAANIYTKNFLYPTMHFTIGVRLEIVGE